MTSPYVDWLGTVVALAVNASAKIMAIYDSASVMVETKDDDSPLTIADLASHEALVEGLNRLTPDIPVLSEEAAGVDPEIRLGWQRFWLVDPLDGTKEFIKRNGEFTVNIALVEDNHPVMGVVWVPARNMGYFAIRGEGAFRQVEGEAPQRLQVQLPASQPPRVVGSRSHAGESLQAYLGALGEHEMVPVGSALKFCLVAEGTADVYPRLGPTWAWDTAAAQCVVEESGGRVVDAKGQPLRYNTREDLRNGFFIVYGDPSRDWLAPLSAVAE